jgi:hypothetical protein
LLISGDFCNFAILSSCSALRDLAALFIHIIANIARLLGPGAARALVAESILVKGQLLILNRAHQGHRIYALRIASLPRCVRRPTPGPLRDRHQTVNRVEFHMALVNRKYRICFGPGVGNAQGLLGQCALAIVATLGAVATLNL